MSIDEKRKSRLPPEGRLDGVARKGKPRLWFRSAMYMASRGMLSIMLLLFCWYLFIKGVTIMFREWMGGQ